jgi:hypothetical protein
MKQTPPSTMIVIGWPQYLENHEKSFLLDEQKQEDKTLS